LLGRLTGDSSAVERATETARSAAVEFGAGDRLWSQPPVFNAIFLRNVLALIGVAPDMDLLEFVDEYLDRVWSTARHRRTGLFARGGIGSYDGRLTIDHAGLTQLFAFRAWPSARWPAIC
jgi:hypothetical protein